uniref:C-type lectin domain-containing protein n=1 Tax=Timema poppense TaxID=170557 RepID=A0A7R9CWK9_TIMPO|nr:unnamed protein product [Timema poppensis]
MALKPTRRPYKLPPPCSVLNLLPPIPLHVKRHQFSSDIVTLSRPGSPQWSQSASNFDMKFLLEVDFLPLLAVMGSFLITDCRSQEDRRSIEICAGATLAYGGINGKPDYWFGTIDGKNITTEHNVPYYGWGVGESGGSWKIEVFTSNCAAEKRTEPQDDDLNFSRETDVVNGETNNRGLEDTKEKGTEEDVAVLTEVREANENEERANTEPLDQTFSTYRRFEGLGYYKLHTKPKTWFGARRVCELELAHLAIINSEGEVAALQVLFQKHPRLMADDQLNSEAFVGLNDFENEGKFVTIFGQDIDDTGFNSWSPRQPDNYRDQFQDGEDCVALYRNGLLNDVPCDIHLPFFCEA